VVKMPVEDQVAVGGYSADDVENPQVAGEFSDDEGDIGIPISQSTDGDLSKDPLLNSDKDIDAEKENSRRALCWSVLAMAMSIPALIGA